MSKAHFTDYDLGLGGCEDDFPVAPPSLEHAVIEELSRRRLIARPAGRRNFAVALGALVVGFFVFGYFVWQGPAPAVAATHLLLLYEGDDYQSPRPGTEAQRVAEYSDWARQLAERGTLVDAAELAPGTEVAAADGVQSVQSVSGEFGSVAGFFLINADDDSEAWKIAANCPHVNYGGRVAVRTLITN